MLKYSMSTRGTLCCSDDSAPLGWRRGAVVSGVRRMNEVNARRRARLALGRVTVFGWVWVYHLGL